MDTGQPQNDVQIAGVWKSMTKTSRQQDIRHMFAQSRTPSVGEEVNCIDKSTSQAGDTGSVLHSASVLHPGENELKTPHTHTGSLTKEKTTVDEGLLDKKDDHYQTSDEMLVKCVLDMTSKKCEIHRCELREIRVNALKWEYKPRQGCFGNVRRKISRWVCSARRGSKPVPADSP